jgi:hypothetical protein
MILMQIVSVMGKYYIRLVFPFQFFKIFLDLFAVVGEITVPESIDQNLFPLDVSKEIVRAFFRFPCAAIIGAENHPAHVRVFDGANQFQYRSPDPDLDVVAMSAEAQDFLRRIVV